VARLNFDDALFKEEGFQNLLISVGDRQKAKGIVWELYELAQKYWYPDRKLIPLEAFYDRNLPEDLYAKGGLAELRDGGVYVKGSEKQFEWLFEARENGKKGGKTSAKRPRDSRGRLLSAKKADKTPKHPPSGDQASLGENPSTLQANPNLFTLSSSLSSPISYLNTPSSELSNSCAGLDEPQAQNVEPPSPTAKVWQAYRKAYEARYKAPATWNGKAAGQIKQFVSRIPAAEAPDVASFYVQHNGYLYVTSGHSVGLMLRDAEKLRTEWLTRRVITSSDARSAEASDSLKNQIARLGVVK
jgi:hypothetical protein